MDIREKKLVVSGINQDEEDDGKRQGFEMSENFGMLVKFHRGLRNLTLKELEEITGISASYLNRIEQAKRTSVSFSKCISICEALSIPYYSLLTTAFNEAARAKETPHSLQELLISNDFLVNQSPINKEAKWHLVNIVEFLLTCSWGSKKVEELFELSKMIDEYKEAVF
jgi:transcriptional regulator with XRE-family HTH domain